MKIRIDKEANYRGVFFNGKTVRQRIDPSKSIGTPRLPEIEDVAINNKCLANCSYCYTSAVKEGQNFDNIIDKALEVWGNLEKENRPFQIAIGGAGEATMHPDFCEFIANVHAMGIVPNYTTNGMHLDDRTLHFTEKYCGGVALSWHPHIKKIFHEAMAKLKYLNNIKLNTHVILGAPGSLDDLKFLYETYTENFDYYVILPYQAAGRGTHVETEIEWLNTFQWIASLPKEQQSKFAFGALFYEWMKDKNLPLKVDMYEPEIYSGYRMMDDNYKILMKSSYDTTPKTY